MSEARARHTNMPTLMGHAGKVKGPAHDEAPATPAAPGGHGRHPEEAPA